MACCKHPCCEHPCCKRGCCARGFDRSHVPLSTTLALLSVGVAVAVITIVFFHLQDLQDGTMCALAAPSADGGYALCIMCYAVAGISLVASLMMAVLVLSARVWDACFLWTPWMELFVVFVGLVVWVGAAIPLTILVKEADDESVPQKTWRHSIVGLSWSGVLLYLIALILAMCSVICIGCGFCDGREPHEARRAAREEEAELRLAEKEVAQEAGRRTPAAYEPAQAPLSTVGPMEEGAMHGAAAEEMEVQQQQYPYNVHGPV
ncbi:hypothetical protein FOA52_015267 [Chlamydomonas sp. UWO 241]|nr:hypothetical protein FOA52_015267 [Chlamydomonas sp. UWO 241]